MNDAIVSLLDTERVLEAPGRERLQFVTTMGNIECHYLLAAGDAAILWVSGEGGGLGGPAGGIYTRLGGKLQRFGVASLELAYRQPGQLTNCIMDVLIGLAWLEGEGKNRIVLVGHSFGGAVVISAADISNVVVGVAALSSQTASTNAVSNLTPRSLLLIHGEADEVLLVSCSQDLYARAREPKRLVIYPGCRHGLDECRESLDLELENWLQQTLGIQGKSQS
jgi:hypothetical protein